MKAGAVAAGGVVVLLTVAFSGGGGGDTTSAAPAVAAENPAAPGFSPAGGGACTGGSVSGLSSEQADIARRGVSAAKRAGVGDAGAAIIVSAGLVESGLKNLNYGDRDSVGWLQQRPSQGWANARNVDKAADDFFAALKAVPGWRNMDPGTAAQKVQRSGFPGRYATQMARARGIVAGAGGGCEPGTSGTVPASAKGKTAAVLTWAQTQVGKPYRMGANGPDAWDCSSFVQAALAKGGVNNVPRTAAAQDGWCAAGNCTRIPEGKEQPGDIATWDSYLGPNTVGHIALVKDPATRTTTDARSSKQGVINGKYPRAADKTILRFWRVKGLAG